MSLFDRRPEKPIEYKSKFFIHAGEWYRNTSEHGTYSCRIEEDSSVVPQEYMEHWAGWKPGQLNRNDDGFYLIS